MSTTRRSFLGASAACMSWGCATRNLQGGSHQPDQADAAIVRLDANESPYGPCPGARLALRQCEVRAARYSDRCEALTAAIATRHRLGVAEVVLGTGSYAVLDFVTRMALHHGGDALVAHPTFPAVERIATAMRAHVVRVPLTAAATYDLDAMQRAVSLRTRLIYLCQPNNPTGTMINTDRIRDFCLRHAKQALVIVDEAYADYVEDPNDASMDKLVRQGLPIVVVRTFSKIFGLAGLRVGYALAPTPLAAALRSVRGGSDRLWVTDPAAGAALASLQDHAFVSAVRRDNAHVRADFVSALQSLGLVVPPSHTSFVYFTPPGPPQVLVEAMSQRGVRISGRADLGGCRITMGSAGEMQRALRALASILPAHANAPGKTG